MQQWGLKIILAILHHRSASPRSRDSKIKREKEIKTEEEEDQKKKEKVRIFLLSLHDLNLVDVFSFRFTLWLLCLGPTFIFGRASCKKESRRGSRSQGENVFKNNPFCPFIKLAYVSHMFLCFAAQVPLKGRARGWGFKAQGAGDGGEAEVDGWGEEEEKNVSGYG